MEQIIRHFGRGIAAVAVALFLVAFLFGGADGKQGLLRMAGAAIKPGSICYTDYNDYKVLQSEAAKPEPVLTETFGERVLVAGQDYKVTDYITAADKDGRTYDFLLEKVLDKTGNEVAAYGQTQDGMLCFEKSGIYTLRIAVSNDAGKRKRYQIAVSVARKQESGGEG